jgi:hypothetical protein
MALTMAKLSILAILHLSLLISSIQRTDAQFGRRIKKGVPISIPQEIINGDDMMNIIEDSGGDSRRPQQESSGFLSEKDAADMSAIIDEAKKDLETMAMITRMKNENSDALSELHKLSTMEVLGGMKEALDNMKLIEYLFQDKERAVREMEKEGMIDKAHIKKYRKDPDLLEQDTRRGLYFQFISLAVVGGFIE